MHTLTLLLPLFFLKQEDPEVLDHSPEPWGTFMQQNFLLNLDERIRRCGFQILLFLALVDVLFSGGSTTNCAILVKSIIWDISVKSF